MNTYEAIQNDIKDAMIGGNPTKRDCLRSIISEIKNRTVNEGKEITDKVCLDVLKKSFKQHSDSIESFKAGNREDLALKEMEEMKYIEKYLPKEMSEDETRQAIDSILQSVECVKKNFGLIMKQLPPEANKKIASKILGEMLK